MKIDMSEKLPIKMWLDTIEDGALEQAKNLAKLPFIFKWVALMPDCHQGYGMPIGGVLATKDVVIPNAVGVDIGCGMCSVKTNVRTDDLGIDTLKNIINKIKCEIPVGFAKYTEPQDCEVFNLLTKIPEQETVNAMYQMGTLGGGNHFIEIQKGSDGYIWIMLHSGSRHLGLSIAKEYHKKAVDLCAKWYSNLPNKDLSFLPINTKEYCDYFECMNVALNYAKENRLRMMEKIKKIFTAYFCTIDFGDIINIHHNYARFENHYGSNVIVHRKGATSAKENEVGIIPGSQGTKSYITTGLGNRESFMSCSHGAGRVLGRTQAQRELNLEKEKAFLNNQGIIHTINNISDLDEAPGAYKNIDTVMENQKDLVKILVELSPMAVIKG